jgi:hypothetical protein
MFDVFELLPQIGLSDAVFFSHTYTVPIDQKVERMKRVIRDWDPRTDKRKKTKKEIKSMTKLSKEEGGGGSHGFTGGHGGVAAPPVTKEAKPHCGLIPLAVSFAHTE